MTHYLYLAKFNSSNATTGTRLDITRSNGHNPSACLLRRLKSTDTKISFPRDSTVYQESGPPFPLSSSVPLSRISESTFPNPMLASSIPRINSKYSEGSFFEYSNGFEDDDVLITDDEVSSMHSVSKVSTSSGCSVSFDLHSCDCHVARDSCELAKRCQQCREIIVAAKEKQEGEARKNANCLLEQIEQEEEERANREAMQARKRERKRMKRKAKHEKERQGKDAPPVGGSLAADDANPDGDQDYMESSSPERRVSVLSQAVQHVRRRSFDSQFPEGITESPEPNKAETKFSACQKNQSVGKRGLSETCLVNGNAPSSEPPLPSKDDFSSVSAHVDPATPSPDRVAAAAVTEAKREKHRNKKQTQRAAKRSSYAETAHSISTTVDSPATAPQDASSAHPVLPATTTDYYVTTSCADDDVDWNDFMDSQPPALSPYLSSGLGVSSAGESSSWTVVQPSNSGRTQRNTTTSRSGADSTDWKTSSSSSAPSKRRISIPVSRHDIGKVIGQGGAVVSALRNMSGIQIDIESARSDEVTERMVYLKGASDAVQRTYETIQGLLSGSIAGNDVLLMYAALKKSTTTASSAVGKSILSALSSKANSAITTTTPSSAAKTPGANARNTGKSNRRTTKTSSSTTVSVTTPTRSNSSQPTVSSLLNRSSTTVAKTAPIVATCANSNNNSTALCTATTLSSATPGSSIMSTKVTSSSSASWSTKLPSAASKGNFASVAAAGLVPQSSRMTVKTISEQTKVSSSSKRAHVPGLMDSFPSVPLSTAPVSLLSLNVTPFSTTSQLFPDLALSFPNPVDVAPDSLDESSFPPLSSTTNRAPVTGAAGDKEPTTTDPDSGEIIEAMGNETESRLPDLKLESLSSINPLVEVNMNSISSVFKPLTVSPPVVTSHQNSQPSTPIGSGNSQATVCSTTPPTTTPQVRQFARAPGSERSAQQRSVHSTVGPLGDTYPPSLMSLEVNGGSTVNEGMLLTPTKRVIPAELQDNEFQSSNGSMRFKSDQIREWRETGSLATAVSQPIMTFSKLASYPLDSHDVRELTLTPTTANQQSLGLSSVSNKNYAYPSDSMRVSAVPSSWPLQGSDLNPNAAAFEPSAFKATVSSAQLPSLGPMHQSADSSSLVPSDYASPSEPTYAGYGLESSSMRHSTVKPPVSVSSLSLEQSSVALNAFPNSPVGVCSALYSPNATVTTASRSKPVFSVPSSTFTDSRALVNGFNTTSQTVAPSVMPGTQFHSLFPPTTQQQLSGGTSLPQPTSSTIGSSRLAGTSPHPLLNQTQLAVGCPPVSGTSYTPPPCIPGFVQPGVPVGGPTLGNHPGGSYSTHILNGTGPLLNTNSLLGSGTTMHQSSTVPSNPVQPIGAERRRQVGSSVAPPGPYPVSTNNGATPYGYPSSAGHLQSSSSSNPNLFMLMNLMQQQQTNLAPSNSTHSSTGWQAASLWPSSTMTGNYPSGAANLMPSSKIPTGGIADLSAYSGANLLAGAVPQVSNSNQQLVAAMAAMSMCPWNSAPSANSSMINAATGGQNRWVYPPQSGPSYSPVNPTAPAYYPEQLSQSMKPSVGSSHVHNTHYPQAVHRPHE